MVEIFEKMDKKLADFYEAASKAMKNYIPEDDYTLDWEDFHKKHPIVLKEDYEMGVKKFQEM